MDDVRAVMGRNDHAHQTGLRWMLKRYSGPRSNRPSRWIRNPKLSFERIGLRLPKARLLVARELNLQWALAVTREEEMRYLRSEARNQILVPMLPAKAEITEEEKTTARPDADQC